MTPNPYLWVILILPLAGAAINGFFGRRSSKRAISAVALVFCGAAFAMALFLAASFSSAAAPYYFDLAHWIRSGNFQVDFSFYLDQLSLVMLLVVTGVGFVIHIYSVGYMWDDNGYYRFMSYLNLFMFFMLTLVLAKNYLVMFIGWEGVGLASYLLIGFWFTKDSAAATTITKKTKTCPLSACQCAANATNERFTPFSINSIDMKIVMMLRLMRNPSTPHTNRIPLSSR